MRQRERFAGLVWLQGWTDILGAEVVEETGEEDSTVVGLVARLVHDFRRYLDVERVGGDYLVRVLPGLAAARGGELYVGLSYVGESLLNILATAEAEIEALIYGRHTARLGRTERRRRVP